MDTQQSLNRFPIWTPVAMHGMRFRDWVKLAGQAGGRVHLRRLPIAVSITGYSLANELLAAIDQLVFARRVAGTQVEQPPVFIIGHWRTGTTLLHELLCRDERFGFATTYETVAAIHFLLTGRVLPLLFRLFMPRKRPMDDMPCGCDRPQEDEFALLAMGAPTPFSRVAFPNEPPPDDDMIDAADASPAQLHRWRVAMRLWIKRLTYAKGKRLVLKSPPHTGKIAELADLFPGARFIHLVRNPYEVFASTRRLWQALDRSYGLQVPDHKNLDDYIFATLSRMYAAFERQRPALDPASICDVAYEDLIADPLAETRRIYEHLQLGDFEPASENFAVFLAGMRDYRPNRHSIDEPLRREIDRRWAAYTRLHRRIRAQTAPAAA